MITRGRGKDGRGMRVVSGGDRCLKSGRVGEKRNDGEWRGDGKKLGFRAGRRCWI